jgi:hypothetical protein
LYGRFEFGDSAFEVVESALVFERFVGGERALDGREPALDGFAVAVGTTVGRVHTDRWCRDRV